MKHFDYMTKNTCSSKISFDMADDGTIHNISFTGGCNGNLKAISKVVDGWHADKIHDVFIGNTCGLRQTSCADQLARAVDAAAKGNLS